MSPPVDYSQQSQGALMPRKWKARYEDVTSDDSILYGCETSYHNSTHKERPGIQELLTPEYQDSIARELRGMRYHLDAFSEFDLWEPRSQKFRHISAPARKTKVVEHMIIGTYMNDILKYLHPNTCACIVGRGTKRCRRIVKSWTRMPKRQRKYYIQGDVYHFFPSIKREVGLRPWKEHIGDTRVINLIRKQMPNEIGLPLGAPLTQMTANLLMTPFDYFCSERCNGYVRYQDDFICIFSSKRKAKKFVKEIIEWMRVNLELDIKTIGKGAIQVWKWEDRPIDIAGYRTTFNGRQILRHKKYVKAVRLLKKPSLSLHQARSLMSDKGWIECTDCQNLTAQIKRKIRKHHAAYIISKGDRYDRIQRLKLAG